MTFKNPKDLEKQLISEGMKPGTPLNMPSHSVWVQDNDGWKLHSGRDGSDGFNRYDLMKQKGYKNAMLTENGKSPDDVIPGMSDYDLFNSIYYPAWAMGRDNYVKGEQEQIWNELNKYFDLPKFNPYMYSFGVNDTNKTVELNKNGVAGKGGFGDWIIKPQFLGPLKRRK